MSVEPAHEFDRDNGKDMRLIPRARPCNIDQYLVYYVDRRGKFSVHCIYILSRVEFDEPSPLLVINNMSSRVPFMCALLQCAVINYFFSCERLLIT